MTLNVRGRSGRIGTGFIHVPHQLRALLVEDSEEDAFLLLRHLRKNDYEVASERVETADALRKALERDTWDIALCDYVMPLLTGEEALRILTDEAPHVPVITVSGNVGEEFAVNVMRAGAKDYVRKDSLSRLIPAIERELADAAARRERRGLEDRLREAEIRAETLFATMEQGVVYRDTSGRVLAANPAAMRIFGLTMDQMQGRAPLDPGWRLVREDGSPLPIEEHPAITSLRTRQPTRGVVMGVETGGDVERRWMLIDAVPEFRPGEDAPYRVFSTFTDITARKKAEAAISASEARFREMADVLPQILWVTGTDGIVQYGTAAGSSTAACRRRRIAGPAGWSPCIPTTASGSARPGTARCAPAPPARPRRGFVAPTVRSGGSRRRACRSATLRGRSSGGSVSPPTSTTRSASKRRSVA